MLNAISEMVMNTQMTRKNSRQYKSSFLTAAAIKEMDKIMLLNDVLF